jgi:tetratricopeptide (TPR) repeat protein
MPRSFAIFVALSFLSFMFVIIVWALTYRLAPPHRRRQTLRWLLFWSLKGLVLPFAIWTLMNLGLSWNLQPFMPEIQAAQNAGTNWLKPYFRMLGYGSFIISSDWAAITLALILAKASVGLDREPRRDFKALCWTAFLGMLLPAAIIILLGGWPLLGLAASAILVPIAGYSPAILQPAKTRPIYARAVAKMKFGKYKEAEWEIIRELEKCEDDFEGWLMMAELYAGQFKDLSEAEQTILEICQHPNTTSPQLSIALHRLADWYLKLGDDPEAARRALEVICDRLPGSHLARMAQLRMNQLPVSQQDLREQREAKPVPLPALGDSLDDEIAPPESKLDHQRAVDMANACVEKLKQDPNNVPARDKLARLLAERLHKPDMAIEQITLLLNMPEQENARRAEWLGLIAAWHIKYRQDVETGRRILERVLEEFPHTPQALAARRRIQLLDVQARQ